MDSCMASAFPGRDAQPVTLPPAALRYEWHADGTCTLHVEVDPALVRDVEVHRR